MNNQKIMLNLGCGQTRPSGWINTDSSLNSLSQKLPLISLLVKKYHKSTVYDSNNAHYMDLRKPWHFLSNSVDVVYASHVFEHLSSKTAKLFMSEAYRVLKKDGVIRIVVPDLYKLAKQYIVSYDQGQEKASNDFLFIANLHRESTYPENRNFLAKLINSLQGYPHQHKYMYDSLSLKKILTENGFSQVQESSYNQSYYISEINQVESNKEGIPSIYIEGKK
ncbi:MAG: methyltransferase domain-containing protein [Gomphosphaeria aponina SAG 52.96 = DSM 107014]|uniref:Methyltransferase domain-containing protein n=1 Tax=Gomphosphaeria aponina SAG 52.96 = DSM 107014 TaxID=1521640 RepID=A0A941GP81_9CHRO|nr:methyltransferase domain-containing protein [Gomphosphaeria aponina SAG 52.96 = DSM 107014]